MTTKTNHRRVQPFLGAQLLTVSRAVSRGGGERRQGGALNR